MEVKLQLEMYYLGMVVKLPAISVFARPGDGVQQLEPAVRSRHKSFISPHARSAAVTSDIREKQKAT